MFGLFKGWGSKPTTQPVAPSPIPDLPGLRLGGSLSVESLAFRVLQNELVFAPPAGDQRIEAYGKVDLGAGSVLHRFYLSEDHWVQINTAAGQVEDKKIFVFADTQNPGTRTAFEKQLSSGSAIGSREYSWAGKTYQRVWGDDSQWCPPVAFGEDVSTPDKPLWPAYSTAHFAMLYQREIPGSERMEYLLISGEETEDGFQIVLSIGVDANADELQIL